MTTTTALKKAQTLKPTQGKTAAHLYATLEWELAYLEQELDNPLLDDKHPQLEQERSTGEAALARIEEMFPDVKAQADDIHEPRELSARATAGLAADSAQEQPKTSDDNAEAAGAAGSSRPAPADSTPAPARPGRTARRRRSVARRRRSTVRNPVVNVAGQTLSLVDQSTGSWGGEIWDFVLGGIGLSLFLLVLSNPTGLTRLMTGASNLVKWVIDPTVDPLRPTGATS